MADSQDALTKTVFSTDVNLPHDLETHRCKDAHQLLKRLDGVHRFSRPLLSEDRWSEGHIQHLLTQLVNLYVNTADSIKLSRAVEKLWQPCLSKYGSFIDSCLEDHILTVFQRPNVETRHITKVSVLFEQSKPVQSVILKNLGACVQWVDSKLLPLVSIQPLALTTTQSDTLYALVKISLQLFQVCSEEMSTVLWLDEACPGSHIQTHVHSLVTALVKILHTEGYHTDCVLLCGTAVSIMLNTCPNNAQAVSVFHALLQHTLQEDSTWNTEALTNSVASPITNENDIISIISKLTIVRMGPVALLRGVVSCGNGEMLLSPCRRCDSKLNHMDEITNEIYNYDVLLFQIYPLINTLCQSDLTLHYHAFQILNSWYTRVIKLASKKKSPLHSILSSILKSSLTLVTLNWDSPVEDVPEIVVDVFTSILTVWETVKLELPDYVDNVLRVLQETPWFVKGKYRILGALIKVVDVKMVLGDGHLQTQLQQCLTTNHLASSATAVYKACLQKYGQSSEAVMEWKSSWLPAVLEGLTCTNSLLRCNISLHWVPVTLKLLPLASDVLQTRLSQLLGDRDTPPDGLPDTGTSHGEMPSRQADKTRVLHAWVIVAKTVRSLTGASDLSSHHVRDALYSGDDEIRSDAISLVCNTLKKAADKISQLGFKDSLSDVTFSALSQIGSLNTECLSDVESSLLKESVPYNIKIDSAPFRQHLGSNIRKLLVRLRDSCIGLLKDPVKHRDKLDCAIEFVDWLHSMCIENLLPGACYQRRKGSLDLLHVIYESLIYRPDNRQRKGFVPDTTVKLVSFASTIGRWNFFKAHNTQTLLVCLLDSAEEIQTSVYQLLSQYYPWPLESQVETPDALCCHLLAESLRLCNSPKGHESESGATLCKLIFQKYVVEHHTSFTMEYQPTTNTYTVSVNPDIGDAAVQHFLSKLLYEIRRCLTEAETNLVRASKQFPIYGLISSLSKCITEVSAVSRATYNIADIEDLCTSLVNLCITVIEKMLAIMAGVAGQEACPSFAEIGMALECLLQEQELEYSESTAISPEYQYLLSWCWNNIKESCTSLGEVTMATVTSQHPLHNAVIESIKCTFITVLTKCRHKGVIEGCRSAFVRFCSALFQSTDVAFTSMPGNILSDVLCSLEKREIASSVTRRSAGLPIIIQAVLVSEKHTKKAVLLSKAVQALFAVCQLPLDADLGLTDLPQVHGLNILNSMFSDASLASNLIGHTSHVTIMVIQQFGSASWGVRNAATRLFSTLVTKIFGQKKSQDGRFCNSVTFLELSQYYPDLPPFILSVLKEASLRDINDISQIHPRLFPVLTLLACLKPTDTEDADVMRQLEQFRETITMFTGSPVYQLRHLVAPACVAMVTMTAMTSSAMSCLNNDVISGQDSNKLHGYLLYVRSVLEYLKGKEVFQNLWMKLAEKSWLLGIQSGIISGLYVQIIQDILQQKSIIEMPDGFEACVLEVCCTGEQSVGHSTLCESSVQLLLTLARQRGSDCSSLVQQLITCASLETRKACLQYLLDHVHSDTRWIDKQQLLSHLAAQFPREPYLQNQFAILELIGAIYDPAVTLTKSDLDLLTQCLTYAEKGHWDYKSRSSLLLLLRAISIKHWTEDHSDMGQKERFCDLVCTCSQATNETERITAVRALQIAGTKLITPEHGKLAVSLIGVSLVLLQDEDLDIRREACVFVTNLLVVNTATKFTSLHSNVCFEYFLHYISEHFWTSPDCISYLSGQLCDSGQDFQQVLRDRSAGRFSQLFDQEDNSFFSEKLYNHFVIHKTMKAIVKKCQSANRPEVLALMQGEDLHESLCKSLSVLQNTMETIAIGTVISVLSDSLVLSKAVGLILYCDIVCTASSDHQHTAMSTTLRNIVKLHQLPSVLQQHLELLSSMDT